MSADPGSGLGHHQRRPKDTPCDAELVGGDARAVLDHFERQQRRCGRARVELHEKSRRNPEGERPEWELAC